MWETVTDDSNALSDVIPKCIDYLVPIPVVLQCAAHVFLVGDHRPFAGKKGIALVGHFSSANVKDHPFQMRSKRRRSVLELACIRLCAPIMGAL